MNVLIWRGWTPAFSEGLTFSALAGRGVGGTETQALMHAAHLAELGHNVQVLGFTHKTTTERDIEFIGAASQPTQRVALDQGKVRSPSLILLEGAYHGAKWLRDAFPSAKLVHIGQNIDRHSARAALSQAAYIDRFAFVSVGHYADYCVRRPDLRHKFVMIRNAIAWEGVHSQVPAATPADKIVWVGSWQKKGLRTWFQVMERVLQEAPNISWTLCGPQYSSAEAKLPRHLYAGLALPWDRINVVSLPLRELLAEMAAARAIIASLGDETAGISTLDAHAMGRPVITGNDLVYKFVNPDGTGLRVSGVREAYGALSFLIANPETGDRLGEAGRRFVTREYSETNQREDLRDLLEVFDEEWQCGDVPRYAAHSRQSEWCGNVWETVRRRWYRLRC